MRAEEAFLLATPTGDRAPKTTVAFDEIDLTIIDLLRGDGRSTNREIASRLGMPESTVRDRLRRMLDGGLMRVVPIVDYRAAGHTLLAQYLVNGRNGSAQDVARQLAAIDDLDAVAVVTGKHDVLAQSFRPSLEAMVATLHQVAAIPGVAEVECRMAFELPICNTENSPMQTKGRITPDSMPTIDPLDRRIIETLCSDGRLTQTEIARRTGIRDIIVRQRLSYLQERHVLRFAPAIDPNLLGNHVSAYVSIAIDVDKVDKIIEKFRMLPCVNFLAPMIGAQYSVVVGVNVRSDRHLLDVLTQFFEIDGVIHTETTHLLQVYKSFAVLGLVR